MTSMNRMYSVIQKPVITEKATDDTAQRNAYHFRVPLSANKVEIRQAVEKLFDVHVESVNTARVRAKWRRRGWTAGETQAWKRALVKLRSGETIEIL
jgi:large subunit ribosomal protein L23